MTRYQVYAERRLFSDGIELHLMARSDTGKSFASLLWSDEIGQDCAPPVNPLITLDATTAQQLMDELWRCGVRPTEGVGSAGSMTAVQRHLADMRKIVEKTLEVKL